MSINHLKFQHHGTVRLHHVTPITNPSLGSNRLVVNQLMAEVNQALKNQQLTQALPATCHTERDKKQEKRELRLNIDNESGEISVDILDSSSQELLRTLDHDALYRGLVINTKV